MEHFATWLCLHSTPTSGHFTFSQSDFFKFHNMSTRYMAIRKVFLSFGRQSINCHQDFKLATPISGKYSYSCSIIFINVVDHATRLELSDKSNSNFFHRWHVRTGNSPLLLLSNCLLFVTCQVHFDIKNNGSIVMSISPHSSTNTLKWDLHT